jgi:uncharacterized protein
MKTQMDYTISFTGLTIGEYEFDFEVDKTLFEEYENEDIQDANVSLNVLLKKEERMLTFDFSFEGVLNVLCDRCLDPLDINVKGVNTLFVKFGDKFEEEDDDVIIIPNKEHKIDLSQYIYEYILLQKPMQCVHQEGKCNKDMLERINKKEENTNESIDPRWATLRDIKFE